MGVGQLLPCLGTTYILSVSQGAWAAVQDIVHAYCRLGHCTEGISGLASSHSEPGSSGTYSAIAQFY